MVTPIRPVSMTILPPVSRTRRPAGSLTALPPPATVGAYDQPIRTVETVSRVERDGATAGRDVRSVANDPVSRAALGLPVTLAQDSLATVHAFAETRGLTLNRHPEAAGAYDRTQALGLSADTRVAVSV